MTERTTEASRRTLLLADPTRIVETIHEPLLLLDDDVHLRYANPSFWKTFETSRDEALGQSLYDLADGHWDIPELRTKVRDLLRDQQPFDGLEVDHSFPGLGRRVFRLNGRLMPWEDGAEVRVLLAIHDVTRQRHLEEKLRRHASELERSNDELEQFAYAASHDLQEPLRMVSAYLRLLERRYADGLDEEAREFIDYAVDGALRMKDLIDGLLQYSRVGRKEGGYREVDLDEVLDEVLEDLAPRIAELGAEIDRAPLLACHGEPSQLRRVLQNLVENALTYHGDSPPHVTISSREESDGTVEVTVADDGSGIPADVQEAVFRLFHQLDPHGSGRTGSGMGLALCRKIIERHGGEIWLESEPGEGSSFRFTLPTTPGSER